MSIRHSPPRQSTRKHKRPIGRHDNRPSVGTSTPTIDQPDNGAGLGRGDPQSGAGAGANGPPMGDITSTLAPW